MKRDKVTLERIELLHPKLKQEVLDIYEHLCDEVLTSKNVLLRLAYTLRTIKEQDDLYSQGRSKLFDNFGKRLGKVTNAKGGQSTHNYGLALDIVFLIDKDNNGTYESASWDLKTDYDKDHLADWMEVVNYFKSFGWIWGGDWKKFKDAPHFEKTFGHDWRSLRALIDSGEYYIHNGVKYPNI